MKTIGILFPLILDKGKSLLTRLKKLWADMRHLGQLCQTTYQIDFEIVKRPPCQFWVPKEQVAEFLKTIDRSFKVLPKRWIVERTFAWIGRNRRTSKEYDYLTNTSENWLYLSMIRLMLKRIQQLKYRF